MKNIHDILKDIELMEGLDAHANRPADVVGLGDPAPTPVPALDGTQSVDTGDSHANRPADVVGVGDPPVDGQGTKKKKPDAVDTMTPMSEADNLVKINRDEFTSLFAEGEMSPEFTEKCLTLIESTVNVLVKNHIAKLNSTANGYFTEQVEKVKTSLIKENEEKTSKYMDFAVTKWLKENALAIENGMKVQIAESFMDGMKSLFESHNIDIPNAKVDLVESLQKKVDGLEDKLSEQTEKAVNLNKMLKEAAKDVEVLEFTQGMSMASAEKVKALAESVEFTTPEQFKTKLKTLAESVTTQKPAAKKGADTAVIVEDTGKPSNAGQDVKVNYDFPEMAQILAAASHVGARK